MFLYFMDFRKKKKSLSHIRNFNKQCFSDWEFLNSNKVPDSSKTHITFQIFLFFLVITVIYSFINLGSLLITDVFFFDLWGDVALLFCNKDAQSMLEGYTCTKNLLTTSEGTPSNLNKIFSKIEIFYSSGVL